MPYEFNLVSRRRCGIIGLIVMSDGATCLLDRVAGLKTYLRLLACAVLLRRSSR